MPKDGYILQRVFTQALVSLFFLSCFDFDFDLNLDGAELTYVTRALVMDGPRARRGRVISPRNNTLSLVS